MKTRNNLRLRKKATAVSLKKGLSSVLNRYKINYLFAVLLLVFSVNLVLAQIDIISPQNITYSNATILINISSTNASYVWFNIDNGNNVTYTNPVSMNFSDGSHTLYAFTNNSIGNITQASAIFNVNTTISGNQTQPSNNQTYSCINIVSPQNITYNVSQILVNISTCGATNVWFNVDNGSNVFYTNPVNMNFSDGSHNLFGFANNSAGISTANVTFNVNTSVSNGGNNTGGNGSGGGGGGGGGSGSHSSSGSFTNINKTRNLEPLFTNNSTLFNNEPVHLGSSVEEAEHTSLTFWIVGLLIAIILIIILVIIVYLLR